MQAHIQPRRTRSEPPPPEIAGEQPRVTLVSAFLSGPILQITPQGFSLQTAKPPRVGEHYPCHLSLDGHAVDFVGRVRWCLLKSMKKHDNGDVVPLYYAGITVVEDHQSIYQQFLGYLPQGSEGPH